MYMKGIIKIKMHIKSSSKIKQVLEQFTESLLSFFVINT